MLQSLINPNYPRAAVGLRREGVSVVTLQKQGRQFGLRRAATVELAAGVLNPDFNESNIAQPAELLATLREAASGAGLLAQKKWSVSLPADAARVTILTLETAPKSVAEKKEVLNWKAERAFGAKADDLRLVYHVLAPDAKGRTRSLAVAMRYDVLDEYELIFKELGWQAGLIMPRHLSEAQWLMLSNTTKQFGDTLMVSSQADGFTAILLRGQQPSVVRSVTCEASEREDELYRLMLFYRDRFQAENTPGQTNLQQLLLIGDSFQPARVHEIAGDTLGYDLSILSSNDVGLILPEEIRFEDVAAPAGLASLAFR